MNKLKEKLKSINGITLIALIVTIIVLLVLAGVVINMALGNDGIISKAQSAVDSYINTEDKEEIAKTGFENKMNSYINNTRQNNPEQSDAGLVEQANMFFNTNIYTIYSGSFGPYGTGQTTQTNREVKAATISIPNSIKESGILATNGAFLELSASVASKNLSPESDGYTYILYNGNKYTLYENGSKTDQKIPLVSTQDYYDIYVGWKNYHTNAYINYNYSQTYKACVGEFSYVYYALNSTAGTNLDNIVASGQVSKNSDYLTFAIISTNFYVDPQRDAFMYILYDNKKYYFWSNNTSSKITIPVKSGQSTYEVHMGWNNYHYNAYENAWLYRIDHRNFSSDQIRDYIQAINKIFNNTI